MRALATETSDEPASRNPAQVYCLVFGALLLLAGAAGFLVNGSFSGADAGVDFRDGTAVSGDQLLWFEVNGWHNVVHLASGAALLAAASSRTSATIGAGAFGVTYLVVTILGLIDGSDVLGIIPVNAADNILHAAIAILGLLVISAPARGDLTYRPRDATPHAAPPSRTPIR